MCISVDLPEPDGPITATSWPCSTSSDDAAQRVDGRRPLAVAPFDVASLDGDAA